MKIYRIAKETTELDSLVAELAQQHPGLVLYVSESDVKIFIHEIRLPKDMQSHGIGSFVITKLQEYAQRQNKPIVLSPEPESRKKQALDRFYRSHGFIPNRGRNKDYSLSSFFGPTMYWSPQKQDG